MLSAAYKIGNISLEIKQPGSDVPPRQIMIYGLLKSP
jgi:hypothetical protein